MNKSVLPTALFLFALPTYVYALGLGEMTVESALDQPFLAEIELVDASSTAMSGINVGLASPKNFEHLGIVPTDILSLLRFEVKKNQQGRYVVRIHSTERMSEPYIQLVVDLTWPKGQIYKAYTVLLDPPGYKLNNVRTQSGLTYHRRIVGEDNKQSTIATKGRIAVVADEKNKNIYGPTVGNESVWQIAQRYKSTEVILPQIVLAIVGKNPQAFQHENLNGLKPGKRLKIPSLAEMMNVPADLATVEVMAHDKAWNEKTTINHVLSPPYIHGETSTEVPAVEYSKIPPIPRLTQENEPQQIMPQLIPPSDLPSLHNAQTLSAEQDVKLKAEISVTTAAVDSLRESNSVLIEQLRLVQADNKKLQEQLGEREKQIKIIRNQIQVMKKERMALAAQNTSSSSNNTLDFWPLLFLLIGVGGGGASVAFWYLKQRGDKINNNSNVGAITGLEAKSEPEVRSEPEVKSEPEEQGYQPESNLLEFESGLHQVITKEPTIQKNSLETNEGDASHLMEFTPSLSAHLPPKDTEPKTDENSHSFDTLLDLAKTYIGMDDNESALNSLNEVIEHGTPTQKETAQLMIEEIKSKGK